MKKERRFIKFLQREGAYSLFIIFLIKHGEIYYDLKKLPPKLFLGWHFQRHIVSTEEWGYWCALNQKWNHLLSKDYSRDRIITQKQKIVNEALNIMLERGDVDEVCRFYYDDIKALEQAFSKLNYQIGRRIK